MLKFLEIRDSLKRLNFGDLNVKNFGEEGDFIIKIEKIEKNNDIISKIKLTLDQNLNQETNLRRVRVLVQK